jgi:delta 1-pyrroline-5-carboxylate dehydrogenase
MRLKSVYTAAILIVLAFNGPLMAGSGGRGISGPGHKSGGGMLSTRTATSQQRADKARQQNRKRERERNSGAVHRYQK